MMTSPPHRPLFRSPGLWAWLLCGALALPLASFASTMMWTTLMAYDDEGYVLHSLADFIGGGALYDRVYSQYGPFYFVLWKGLASLGLTPTHDHGRSFTLVLWLACAGLCALLTWRLSRHWLATGASLAFTCVYLWPMGSEPSHPGSLVCLLGIMAALLVTVSPRYFSLALAVLGFLTAALLLTKINTGVFLLCGIGACLCLRLQYSDSRYSWLRWPLLASCVALPWLLVRPLLAQAPMFGFGLVLSSSLAACLLCRPSALRGLEGGATITSASALRVGLAALLPPGFVLTLLAGIVLILGACLLTGSSVAGLVEGILLAPLRFPNAFTTPINWRPASLFLAAAAPVLCVLAGRLRPGPRELLLTAGGLVLLIAFLLCWLEWVPLNMQALLMSYGLSFTWLFCMPAERSDTDPGAMQFVSLLCLLQALQAFPVGGSQISWGTVLWLPLCTASTIPRLCRVVDQVPRLGRLLLVAGTSACCLLLLYGSLHHDKAAARRLADTFPMDLPGAAQVQGPVSVVSALRVVCDNARYHGDVLFSEPGVYSLNLWTKLPTPTADNATLWFRLLDIPAQRRIEAALDQARSPIIIREHSTLGYLQSKDIPREGPLVDHIENGYSELFRLENYSVLLRKGATRHQAVCILSHSVAGEGSGLAGEDLLTTFIPTTEVPEDSVWELHLIGSQSSQKMLSSSGRLRLLPPETGTDGLTKFSFAIPPLPPGLPKDRLLLLARSSDNRILKVARFPGKGDDNR